MFQALWQMVALEPTLVARLDPIQSHALKIQPDKAFLFEPWDCPPTLDWPRERLSFFWESLLLIQHLSEDPKTGQDALVETFQKALSASKDEIDALSQTISQELARETSFESPLQWALDMLYGYRRYLESGVSPFDGFYCMRRMHFLTNNRLSRILGFVAEVFNPFDAPFPQKNLLDLTPDQCQVVARNMQAEAYHVFDPRLPTGLCREIVSFAETTPCYPSMAGQEIVDHLTGKRLAEAEIFDPMNPRARRYDFDAQDLLRCAAIQKIIADPVFMHIAAAYLQATPVLNLAYLWWSSDFQGEASRYTGQEYHVDLDRACFVNFFFFLNDVETDNGPHVYIRRSHHTKPLELSVDKRMSEAELLAHYPASDLVEICGPQGTVFVGDTKAFHRGQPLKKGKRLILQLDFATDRFGEHCPQRTLPPDAAPELLLQIKNHPFTLYNLIPG